MTYINKVKKRIKSLTIGEVIPFSEVKVDGVSTDTVRKTIHRLHDCGLITIISRGHFKKEEPYKELLFVYGSLKKGFDNHHLISKYTKRLGKAKTVKKFGMFEDSFGNYPYLIDTAYNKIQGELYEITRRDLMDKIDAFEGAPDYYQREKIEVKSHRGVQRAFVYIQANTQAPIGQSSLTEWSEDNSYKIRQLNNYALMATGILPKTDDKH